MKLKARWAPAAWARCIALAIPGSNRLVAIKSLPAAFAQDPERVARFKREAQLLAALNHPHIAGIHGLEEANGSQFLVLEFVDGETLADRLAKGPIPLAEALRIAREVVDALEAAHEKGIIHRDLKPANVALTAEGKVKVLDFGLARYEAGEVGSSVDVTASPTLAYAGTQAGIILGTAAYMSPEQAKGRPVDKRSDVWAFGCLLFEMLTGKKAFEGEDVSDTLAAILRGEPDWSALPADVPPALRTLIKRCLERDRRSRIPDLSVVRFLMADNANADLLSASGLHVKSAVVEAPTRQRAWVPWLVAAVLALGLASVVAALVAMASRGSGYARAGEHRGRRQYVAVAGFDGGCAFVRRHDARVCGRRWAESLASLHPAARSAPGDDAAEHRRRQRSVFLAGRSVGRRSSAEES